MADTQDPVDVNRYYFFRDGKFDIKEEKAVELLVATLKAAHARTRQTIEEYGPLQREFAEMFPERNLPKDKAVEQFSRVRSKSSKEALHIYRSLTKFVYAATARELLQHLEGIDPYSPKPQHLYWMFLLGRLSGQLEQGESSLAKRLHLKELGSSTRKAGHEALTAQLDKALEEAKQLFDKRPSWRHNDVVNDLKKKYPNIPRKSLNRAVIKIARPMGRVRGEK